MRRLVIAAALLWSAGALADQRVVIIDGDTVDIDGERIRILNIDAPETRRSRCEEELILGLRAKQRLAELLRDKPVVIDRCESSGRCTDRYGRTLARLYTPDGDVGRILIAEGLAQLWISGKAAAERRLMAWCKRLP